MLTVLTNIRSTRHAPLRFSSLAEQCHTQKFYQRCFNSDFDAVKSKFGLLIDYIEMATSNSATLRPFSFWLSSAKLKIFISGVSIRILML